MIPASALVNPPCDISGYPMVSLKLCLDPDRGSLRFCAADMSGRKWQTVLCSFLHGTSVFAMHIQIKLQIHIAQYCTLHACTRLRAPDSTALRVCMGVHYMTCQQASLSCRDAEKTANFQLYVCRLVLSFI